MKRCPECRRDYYDETLRFCLDDGTSLVDGPATDESATAILPSVDLGEEFTTPIFSQPGADRGTQTGITAGVADATGFSQGESMRPLINTGERTEVVPGEISRGSGAPPASSAEFIFGEIKRHKRTIGVVTVALLLATSGIVFALYKFWGKTAKTPQAIKIERLTTIGKSANAAISPDGKYVVYSVDEGGGQSLWARQVAASNNVQIIPPAEDVYYWVSHSRLTATTSTLPKSSLRRTSVGGSTRCRFSEALKRN